MATSGLGGSGQEKSWVSVSRVRGLQKQERKSHPDSVLSPGVEEDRRSHGFWVSKPQAPAFTVLP